MPETVSAEEYKEQFGRDGFLAPVMDLIAHNNRAVHAEWFDLARDTNSCLQAIAVKAMEENGGAIGDKNVLSTLLLLRSLGFLQGSIMLLEKGMLPEARTLMRSLLETSFCLGASRFLLFQFVLIHRLRKGAICEVVAATLMANGPNKPVIRMPSQIPRLVLRVDGRTDRAGRAGIRAFAKAIRDGKSLQKDWR